MSEKSFDTSAADTLTSGVSLGQFIKSVAEEVSEAVLIPGLYGHYRKGLAQASEL